MTLDKRGNRRHGAEIHSHIQTTTRDLTRDEGEAAWRAVFFREEVSVGGETGISQVFGAHILIAGAALEQQGSPHFRTRNSFKSWNGRLSSDGLMYLVAGTGTAGTTGDGGAATSAKINTPRSAWGDSIGNIYIAETGANKVRVVDTAGNIHTFAGAGGATSTGDGGSATAANFDNPQGVFVDANLNVYITDSVGKIRVVCVTCGTGSPLDNLLGILGINSPMNSDIYTIAGNGSGAAYGGTYPTFSTNVSMAPLLPRRRSIRSTSSPASSAI
jgi:hypothetical protein